MNYRYWKVSFFIGLFLGSNFLYATSKAVTQITTYTQPSTATTYTVGGHTYSWGSGVEVVLDTFTADGDNYSPSAVADNVIVRRVDNDNVSGERCRLFAERNDENGYSMLPSLDCNPSLVMSGRVINRGWLDVFANDDNNIERVDFIFSKGLVAPSGSGLGKTGFISTEKNANNPTVMAVITGLDANGDPLTYAPLVKIWPHNTGGEVIKYGKTDKSFDFSFVQDGSTVAGQDKKPTKTGISTEPMGVAFVTLDDLAITEGQTIYGFSYFSQDIYGTNIDPVDYNSFPTDTSGDRDVADADMYGGVSGYFSVVRNISGKVYEDKNKNSTQDAGENNLANIISSNCILNSLGQHFGSPKKYILLLTSTKRVKNISPF